MKKIIIFGMVLVTLVLVGCVKSSYVSKNVDSKEIIEKPTCVDECSQSTCDGLYNIACSVGADGCKYKQLKEKIMGKCGINCLEDSDCSTDEICSFNKCMEDCPQLDQVKIFEYRPLTDLSKSEFWINQSDNEKVVDGYNVSWDTHVECVNGFEEGENINYWYCGKSLTFWESYIYLEKTTIDSNGNIIQKVKKRAINVYDENFNFEKTICFS